MQPQKTLNIQLKPYEDSHTESLRAYQLPPEQTLFTALPEKVFERIAARNALGDFSAVPISILLQDEAIGLFVLDSGPDLDLWTANRNAVFLRSFSINPAFQGKGIGTLVMQRLPEFIASHLPELYINEIVLGVNRENKTAQKLYHRIGFNEYGFNMNPPFVGQIIMKWCL
ncbi:MAG: GNAT family N-acetyltransferase [Sphingobacteriales bacterium]|nr:MAG: GNAT family N-acetyltransferase [Sphingobacteriales bacterium]